STVAVQFTVPEQVLSRLPPVALHMIVGGTSLTTVTDRKSVVEGELLQQAVALMATLKVAREPVTNETRAIPVMSTCLPSARGVLLQTTDPGTTVALPTMTLGTQLMRLMSRQQLSSTVAVQFTVPVQVLSRLPPVALHMIVGGTSLTTV